jgi:F-type H+-transporting ATPase subunit delta
MDNSRIGIRYAKALFMSANEKGLINEIYKNIIEVVGIFQSSKDLSIALQNPVIKPSAKKKVIETLFAKNVNTLVIQLIHLMIDNKRELFILDTLKCFVQLYRKEKNIRAVTLTTAIPIDNIIENEIITAIKKHFNAEVELDKVINPSIIGGFILRIDDVQYDTSALSQLHKIKRQLLTSEIK